MPDRPPDFNEIKEMKVYSDKHWQDWRNEAMLDYDYFREGVPKSEFNMKMGANSRYVEMRPAKARELVISATTQMLANPLKFKLDKLVALNTERSTIKAEEEADYTEALLDAILYHTTRKAGNADPVRASSISMFITGMGALEGGYDESDNPRPLRMRKGTRSYERWMQD